MRGRCGTCSIGRVPSQVDERCARIARIVRDRRADILARWMSQVRADDTIPSARSLTDAELLDHTPTLLDELVAVLEGHEEREERLAAARRHGGQRASFGFHIREVMREMGVLRRVLVEMLESAAVDLTGTPGCELHRVLDESLGASAETMEAATRAVIERERDEAESERQRAERLNEEKDLFVAVVAHEIRNPLHAMMGWTALARERAGGDPLLTRAIETIERNVALQRRLVDDLLDLERVRSGKLSLDLRPVDLDRVVEAALASARPSATSKGVELTRAPAPTTIVLGDADRLQQVVSNLLVNALKFTPRGGHVELTIERDADQVRVAVRDDGVGIAPELQESIFEPFRQGDPYAGARAGGIGIGLAIVRELVRAHGGRVGAESEGLGRGATFWLTLPLARPAR